MLEGSDKKYFENLLGLQEFDCLAVGAISFKNNNFQKMELSKPDNILQRNGLYFDLASITKPFCLATSKLIRPDIFNNELNLLINHRGGLPWWGRLARDSWREKIASYEIKESDTVYSDYSALRAMIEIEKLIGKPLYEFVSVSWDKYLKSWLDLAPTDKCAVTGFRNGKNIIGEVHDPNAFVLKERVSHAGLFGTIDGVCKTLLNLNNKYDLLETVMRSFHDNERNRFIGGWDTVVDCENTLAGKGVSKFTFGHLGFTGTSLWIDIKRRAGQIILTNATQKYWYNKNGLNDLRKSIGEKLWKRFSIE